MFLFIAYEYSQSAYLVTTCAGSSPSLAITFILYSIIYYRSSAPSHNYYCECIFQ